MYHLYQKTMLNHVDPTFRLKNVLTLNLLASGRCERCNENYQSEKIIGAGGSYLPVKRGSIDTSTP
ncbi:hypothetical protein XSR1_150077 [Xenorhabdus szentirmaii DSM 16338]|uniref:Uncharacterized protein n=1 Tax=Xenorhabdus szentirmaii DSM 16338 TaxID=1427518 RepID=W1ITF9_9GAMM|nr:hypothetical protein XSR1_150077 [Xenorhabdus szentirmaii DSM 16338]